MKILNLVACSLSAGLLLLSSPLILGKPTQNVDQTIHELKSNEDPYFQNIRKDLTALLALRTEEIHDLVPTAAGIFWLTCPHCKSRTKSALWNWNFQDPHHIQCADCKSVFPDNKDYPYDGKDLVNGIEYPYYTSPDGVRYHFGLAADFRLKQYLTQSAYQLAELYAHTQEDQYAETASAILEAFADKFPHYPIIRNGFRINKPTEIVPFSWDEESNMKNIPFDRRTRWSYWRYMDTSKNILFTLDALAEWPGLHTERGKQIREKVLNNLLIPQGDWVRRMYGKYYGNMTVSTVYPRQILLARLSNDPSRMHDVLDELEKFSSNQFLYDGSWFETSLSYGRQVWGGLLNVITLSKGYSDPEGYVHPETGKRIDHLNLANSALFKRLSDSLYLSRFPNGRLLILNDTWASSKPYNEREKMEPFYFPGLGVAVLGTGEKENQLHTYLSFTSGAHHKQNDSLSIGLFAQGEELLPSIGYTHTRYRRWAISMMSHNTVVVNGIESQFDKLHTGNIPELFYADRENGLQMVVARSESAYPKITQTYRRALLLIGDGSKDTPYILDLFQITGGNQHDYLLHGSRDYDATVTLPGITLTPYPGTLMNPNARFTPPLNERDNAGGKDTGYGFVRNLSQGSAPSRPVEVIIALSNGSNKRVRSLIASQEGSHVYTGASPSVRRAGGRHYRENDALLDRDLSPFFCLRRTGEELNSFFAVTHEPLQHHEGEVLDIQTTQQDGVYLIQVTLTDNRIDYIAFAPEKAAATLQIPLGTLEFEGKYAILRSKDNQLDRVWSIGCNRVVFNENRLTDESGELTGNILHYSRTTDADFQYLGYFDLDKHLPEGDYASFHIRFADETERSFNIVQISESPTGQGSRLWVREDPGFNLKEGKTLITSFPRRSIKGEQLTYQISKINYRQRSE